MKTNPDSTQVTFSQVYTDVKQALNGMADALKVGAEHVYEVIVRQQIVESITYLIVYAVVGAFSYILFRIGRTALDDNNDEVYVPLFVFSGFSALILLAVIAITLDNVITGFVNPEYGAIMEIKSFVK